MFPVWWNKSPRCEGTAGRSPEEPVVRDGDLFRFMQEITKGMVVVSSGWLLCYFGMLGMSSWTISCGVSFLSYFFFHFFFSDRALRWQVPESMSGLS